MRLCLVMLIYSLLSVLVTFNERWEEAWRWRIVILTKAPAKIIQNKMMEASHESDYYSCR